MITAILITYADSIVLSRNLFPTLYLSIYIPLLIAPPIIYFLIAVVIKLDNSEKEVAAVIKSAGDAFFIHDDKGNLIEVNDTACRSLGYTRAELMDLRVSDYEINYNQDIVRKNWHDLVQGQAITLEGTHRRKNGETFPVEVRLAGLIDGGKIKIVALARDVTERRARQEKSRLQYEQLAHVARVATMGEMATGIAHELNQPLTAVAAYVDGCLRRLDSGEEMSDAIILSLRKASDQAHRAGEIISRLRKFIGNVNHATEKINVNETIRTVLDIIETDISLNQVELHLNLGSAIPLVAGDSILIQQVILNLTRNAVEAMQTVAPSARALTINTTFENGLILLAVEDTGAGIMAGDNEKVFEPFYSTKSDGLGMGLAICRSIIENHGGKLWLEQAPNLGAAFHINLPRFDAEETQGE
ncbi:MAG: PAS domain S-box protein [Rhodospirillaceae bacterium]|nr:PAS domain S-box protein [Rhodospirillaceae bacterium]